MLGCGQMVLRMLVLVVSGSLLGLVYCGEFAIAVCGKLEGGDGSSVDNGVL